MFLISHRTNPASSEHKQTNLAFGCQFWRSVTKGGRENKNKERIKKWTMRNTKKQHTIISNVSLIWKMRHKGLCIDFHRSSDTDTRAHAATWTHTQIPGVCCVCFMSHLLSPSLPSRYCETTDQLYGCRRGTKRSMTSSEQAQKKIQRGRGGCIFLMNEWIYVNFF